MKSRRKHVNRIGHDKETLSAGPRSYQLMLMSYQEAGLPVPGTTSLLGRYRFSRIPEDRRYTWFKRNEPQILLFPQSYVTNTEALSHEKHYRFNFLGLLYPRNVFPHRHWILNFAKQHFDESCYFCITSLENCEKYESLGVFDRTLSNQENKVRHFVPKRARKHDRTYFDASYFEVMTSSRFTLCPRGDRPWSMRFFEAILSRSIPVLEDPLHAGRNDLERAIGYHWYTIDQKLEYREDWVEENYQLFLENQTLTVR